MLQPEKKELKWNDNKTTKQGGKRKTKKGHARNIARII